MVPIQPSTGYGPTFDKKMAYKLSKLEPVRYGIYRHQAG